MDRMFLTLLGAGCATLGAAQAVLPDTPPQTFPFEVRAGYTISANFEKRNGDSGTLRGPEIGLNLPVGSYRGTRIAISPSYFLGGRLASGSDEDGNVLRFQITLRRPTGPTSYVDFGLGMSSTIARTDDFEGQVQPSARLTLGFDSSLPLLGKTQVEVTGHLARQGQASGFTLGLSKRF